MVLFIDIMKLLAGIGLFLFAMFLIEEALKNLSGRNLKLFLQRITKNSIGAISGGAIVTAILQSSSMVSLMVIAFVGAGVFTLKNALAIILGANLGTTIDNWMVATLGFKTNIEIIAYPVVFIGGLLIILFGKRKVIKHIAYFLLGFGLLFIGIAFLKTAMENQVKNFDFAQYANMPSIVFLLIGFSITLLVQSSSVTMALTLSALHVGAIDFHSAAAIVLGSETGTTIKILISGIGGSATKKRVVLGNLLFNVVLTIIAFIFLKPILFLINTTFGISNPLIGLVSFSTLVNLFSILIFLPFLNLFVRFLERFFKHSDDTATAFISNASIDEPHTALDLFKQETAYFIFNCMLLNLELLTIENNFKNQNPEFLKANERKKISFKTSEEKYEFIKQLQGDLQLFYLKLRTRLEDEQETELTQLTSSARSAMHATKNINDIKTNINQLKASSKNMVFEFYNDLKTQTENLYVSLFNLLNTEDNDKYLELERIFNETEINYSKMLDNFYANEESIKLESSEVTTAISFNRSLFTSHKAMIMAVKDFLLEEKQAIDFNEIPIYNT